ncbi:hypothetical protein BT63DRAFT_232999 [Microthyrium microscopicum]|uniref:Uncharacterized protein n=1 Tax=Microthyrium microscopicum TaxID=703497 RepID=A0A6A6UDB0_9PEZI|nr:hypothetical protein BT63DRAFT_232999 [Microthyrium microscopicum]
MAGEEQQETTESEELLVRWQTFRSSYLLRYWLLETGIYKQLIAQSSQCMLEAESNPRYWLIKTRILLMWIVDDWDAIEELRITAEHEWRQAIHDYRTRPFNEKEALYLNELRGDLDEMATVQFENVADAFLDKDDEDELKYEDQGTEEADEPSSPERQHAVEKALTVDNILGLDDPAGHTKSAVVEQGEDTDTVDHAATTATSRVNEIGKNLDSARAPTDKLSRKRFSQRKRPRAGESTGLTRSK